MSIEELEKRRENAVKELQKLSLLPLLAKPGQAEIAASHMQHEIDGIIEYLKMQNR